MSHKLWQVLEELPGVQAALQEWRNRLGPDFALVKPLLRPIDRLAASISGADDPYSSYRVVCHAADDIVGVPDRGGPTITLSKADVLIYRLDHQRVIREVVGALGIELNVTAVDGVPHTYHVGAFHPFAGFAFPAFFTIPFGAEDLLRATEVISALHNEPFVLLAPTSMCIRPACVQLLKNRNACFLALNESIEADGRGKWTATEAAQRRLAEFQRAVVPQSDVVGVMSFFPTPPTATWRDVRIKFVDGETVSIKVGNASGTFVYSQLGMADGRNAKSTRQWELLIAFARGFGVVTWNSSEATRKNQKRREILAANLKKFFRIDGEPIEYVEESKGWRTLFTIEPDA